MYLTKVRNTVNYQSRPITSNQSIISATNASRGIQLTLSILLLQTKYNILIYYHYHYLIHNLSTIYADSI